MSTNQARTDKLLGGNHHRYGTNNSSVSAESKVNGSNCQYSCLITRQKTQKRKTWQDGRLVLRSSKAYLYAVKALAGSGDPVLDTCDLTPAEYRAIISNRCHELETEKYLVTVEGHWVAPKATDSSPRRSNPSSSMQKILNKKFRRPAKHIPPPARNRDYPEMKRRHPLQPGELHKIHYGGFSAQPAPTSSVLQVSSLHNSFPREYGNGSHATDVEKLHVACTTSSDKTQSRMEELSHSAYRFNRKGQQSSSRQGNDFSGSANGYDPTSFYGEDHEDSEEDTSEPDIFSCNLRSTLTDLSGMHRSSDDETRLVTADEHLTKHSCQPTKVPDEGGGASTVGVRHCSSPAVIKNSIVNEINPKGASTLSTSQLLNLFENESLQSNTQVESDEFLLPSDTSSDED